MIKILKNNGIKKEKPELKLYPNHYHYVSGKGRTWQSEYKGQAISDGRGWYKQK